MSNRPVVVDAIRTPMGCGKVGGALSGVHPVDLLAGILKNIIMRNFPTHVPSTTIDRKLGR